MFRTATSTLFVFALLLASAVQAATVEVQALLGETAVLRVNGERKLLRPGDSHGGVTLVSTTREGAVLLINGQTRTLGLSQRVGTTFQEPTRKVVTIPRNNRNQYLTTALINGRSIAVLVDTGANVVAMSQSQAQSLGIRDGDGPAMTVETAGGILAARQVMLDSVSVGGIRVDRVEATVVQSEYPGTVLLGMSYLRHVKIEEQDGILSLIRAE